MLRGAGGGGSHAVGGVEIREAALESGVLLVEPQPPLLTGLPPGRGKGGIAM